MRNKLFLSGILVFSCFLMLTCSRGKKTGSDVPVYLNTAYSFEERAADLVSRMTLEEKQSLLGNIMPAVPRLGINYYNVWGEALHGVMGRSGNRNQPKTSFPNSIAVGATWDPALLERETSAISDEARGLNYEQIYTLTYWSPVVEPIRDPRWGRTGESYGEDPFLISQIAGGFIRGLMGDDDKYLKAVPCGKHYFANNSEFNRHTGSSDMDSRDAREFYLAPYKKLIEIDNLPAIMSCYNAVNQVPVSANKFWIDTIARKTYGLYGYVTGDCGAIDDITNGHFYAESLEEAAALGLKAGVNTDCGSVYQAYAINALRDGLITEADIDLALVNMFTVRMRLGEFDPKSKVPYASIEPDVVNTPGHNALAIEVATKTPVLLKNEPVVGKTEKALPLKAEELSKIAVFGPLAESVELGPYSGMPDSSYSITPLAGIRDYISRNGLAAEVLYDRGANTASRSDLFEFSEFEIVKSNGSAKKYDATEFEGSAKGIVISTWRSKTLKGIKEGDWTSYNDVDISNIDSIRLNLNVRGIGGIIEARIGSPTGKLLASFDAQGVQRTGRRSFGRFGRSRTLSARVNRTGMTGKHTLVFVYHAKESVPISEETVSLASSSDVAIVYAGTDNRTAGEQNDRFTLLLPGNQYELIKAVSAVNPYTIVVMQGLGMVEVEQFKDLPNVAGILWTGFNGQAQGTALASILFGDVNPGGKLNFTWFKSVDDLPEITDYDLRGGKNKNGRTYWYFDKDVSYEFGYGLSYTTFEYSNFKISNSAITPNDKITVSVDVQNTGDVDGDEIVQVYVKTPDSPASPKRPVKRLKGFKRVSIPAGKTRTVKIDIDCSGLWFWDGEMERITFDQGEYVFEIGASSEDIKGEVTAEMSGTFHPVIKTVVAECGKVVLKLGDKAQTSVTAAMTDDSFYDVAKAEVTYESSEPAVASVDNEGLVTANRAGVASITAAVTIEGKTISDSYPLKVMPDLTLSSLTLNGNQITVFNPEVHAYSVLLSDPSQELPQVMATPAGNATVDVNQAETVPGTTVITVRDNSTGEEGIYNVNYGINSSADEFDGTDLGEQWSWVRENSDNWELSEGYLVLTSKEGGIQGTSTYREGGYQGTSNNAENILLQDANTDWTIETSLHLPEEPPTASLQSGLIAYQDDDNYIKLIYNSRMSRRFGPRGLEGRNNEFVQLAYELAGAQYLVSEANISSLLAKSGEIKLKLEKKGSIYKGYYSIDGVEYELGGSAESVLSDIKAGLITCEGTSSDDRRFRMFRDMMGEQMEPKDVKVGYDYFHISNTGIE